MIIVMQFNHIIELSLNPYEKTDDQKKRISESIFNSQISEHNTPINAMRKVTIKKKKKNNKPHTPGIEGAIAEDPEGEDEEYEEVVVYDNGPGIPAQSQIVERADVEMSSDEEKKGNGAEIGAPKDNLQYNQDESDEDDGKKGKKDKKDKKDKKGKKKEKEQLGYNEEDINKGKKLMANPNFKDNLERLRSQFKSQPGGLTRPGQQQPPKISLPTTNGMKKLETEDHTQTVKKVSVESRQSLGRDEPEELDKGSNIILGQSERFDSDGFNSRIGQNSVPVKLMKEAERPGAQEKSETQDLPFTSVKAKPKTITPNVELPMRLERPSRAVPKDQTKKEEFKEDEVVPKLNVESGKPLDKLLPTNPQKSQVKMEEDWDLNKNETKNSRPSNPGQTTGTIPRITASNSGAGLKPTIRIGTGKNKGRKVDNEGSDNSWDKENPFQ